MHETDEKRSISGGHIKGLSLNYLSNVSRGWTVTHKRTQEDICALLSVWIPFTLLCLRTWIGFINKDRYL